MTQMTSKVFFDTNILVYTIGQHDARTPAAESLLEDLQSGHRRPTHTAESLLIGIEDGR